MSAPAITQRPSPNFDSRDGQAIDMLVLHYTGMPTAREALDRLCDAQAKVSAHYVVDEDGTIYQLVAEENRAWHAGVSAWRGHSNINQRSIGIEIVNRGHEFGYHPFPGEQMKSVATMCKGIVSRHAIPKRNVVGHSDVAPARKEDPGELFDWEGLAAQGIGLWPIPEKCSPLKVRTRWIMRFLYIVCKMNRSPASRKPKFYRWQYAKRLFEQPIIHKLHTAGYGFLSEGIEELDQSNHLIFKAFQRHYRPHTINGKWDVECQTLLDALLTML